GFGVVFLYFLPGPVFGAGAPPAPTTMSTEAVKAIGSKIRAGVIAKLGKRVTRKNVELAQFGNAAPTGGWNVVPPTPGPAGAVPGVGAGAGAGAGAAGAAAGAGAAGAAAAGGIGVGAAAAAAGVAAAASVGVAVSASSSGGGGPIISVSP
ncbi:hypothetical protein, partial [Rhizorhabdus sp.]|uniref:hypothetical protein n=1 Tax=Rhizorhabdus sp. TaxID=1968843 RepID=UPI0035B2AF69